MGLKQSDEVSRGPITDFPALANEAGGLLWAVKVAAVGGHWEARKVEVGKLDVALKTPGNVNCQLPVSKRLISGELAGRPK